MAIIKGGAISGKFGKLVGAKWKDLDIIRTVPRKRKAGEWSEKQIAHRKCFAAANAFARNSRESLIKPIWNRAATGHFSGYNIFMKANKPAFEPAGELIDPRMLKMTTGKLPLPFNIAATYECGEKVSIDVSWENADALDFVHDTDKLMIILFRNLHFTAPIDTGFTRIQAKAHIELSPDYRNRECIYIFFQNQKGDEFSDSFGVLTQ